MKKQNMIRWIAGAALGIACVGFGIHAYYRYLQRYKHCRIHHKVNANSTLICKGHKMPVIFQSLFRFRP